MKHSINGKCSHIYITCNSIICNYEDTHPGLQKRSPQTPPGGKNLERKTPWRDSARQKSSGRAEGIVGSGGSMSKNMEMRHNMMNVGNSAAGISSYTNPIIDMLCQSRCPNVCLVYNLACVHAQPMN